MATPFVPYLSRPYAALAIGWRRCSLSGSSEALECCPEPSPPLNNLLSEIAALERVLFH